MMAMKGWSALVLPLVGVSLVSACSTTELDLDPNSLEPPAKALTWTSLTEGFGHSAGTIPLVSGASYAVQARCGGKKGEGFAVDISYEDGTSIASYRLQCPEEIHEPFEVSGEQRVTMSVFPLENQKTPVYNSYASIIESDDEYLHS